jgi:flagellar hook-length control protein FliK
MPVLFLRGRCSVRSKTPEKAGRISGPGLALGEPVSTTGSYVAAIASTRIASGGGVFHKPQANDAGTANGTDASSPFQQMLSTAATVPTRNSSDQNGQTDRARTDSGKTDGGKTDSGKKSGKDSKIEGTAGQPQQAANQIIAVADSKTLIQASAANDAGQDDAGESDSGSGSPGKDTETATAAGQTNDSSAQQAASDASQSLAAQLPVSTQDAQDANNKLGDGADNGSDETAALLASDLNKSTAPTQTASADNATPVSASVTDTTSDASKPGKAKRDAQDAASAQIQAKDASAQINSTTQSSAPAAKKDHKSAKAGDQGNSTAPTAQATPPDPTVAIVASAAPLPTTPATANDTVSDSSDAIAAAAIGQAKDAAKNSQVNSNPPAGAKTPAGNDQASGGASKTNSANGPSPADASSASQSAAATPGSDASQSADNNPPASAGDKGDNQTSAAPAQTPIQAPIQAAQPQPQPQAGVLPAVQPQQAHTGATDSVTQNIQVAQSDSNTNASTVSALAVAIAARSQSGNKQFDIRLDPPELGRVEVRLSIDATGKAQASLSADQPRTLDLLKTDAPALTRALRDAGLNVSQNGLNFSLRGQDRQNGGNGFTPRSGRSAQTSLIATSVIGSVQGGANYQGSADGRLDIRV